MTQDNPGWLARHAPRLPGDIARTALIAFGVIATGVTVIAVIESYSNLLAFALAYGLSGWRAAIAPGAIDSFIILGELLLFAAILLHWGAPPHVLGAAMAAWGFLLSVGGNIWHAHSATAADRAVSAVWPVTATAALAGALLIVRQVTMTPPVSDDERAELPVPVPASPAISRGVSDGEPSFSGETRPRRRRGPASAVDEGALLAKVLEAGVVPRSYQAWSFEETGMYRSAGTKRVYDLARERLGTARPDEERAAMNGAGHAPADR